MRTSVLGLLVVAVFGGCGGSDHERRVVVTGSSTVAPLAAAIAERFQEKHPGVLIDVQTGGSARGIADVRSGVSSLGMASRALTPEEGDLTPYTIALDGIGIIVHADNPLSQISSQQVRDIYTGVHADWGQVVPGRSGAIAVVHKAAGRSTQKLFLEHFELEDTDVKPSVVIGDNEQGIKTVAGNPRAIGYVSVGAALYAASHGVPIRALPLDGVAASLATVNSGDFPIARPLQWVVKGEPEGIVKELIDFSRSEDVHDLIAQHVFVVPGS